MRVLVACEFSAVVRDAFRNRGHDAWSCDLLPTEGDPSYHIQSNALTILKDGWDMLIAHPPCTYLTNAGVRHLFDHVQTKNGKQAFVHGKERWKLMEEAASFFNTFKDCGIHRIAIENPIPHKYAKQLIGKYNQLIQPWMFGHKKSKAICLWLKNLPPLIPMWNMQEFKGPPPKRMSSKEKRDWHEVHYASPGKDRWKKRSRFFEGVARAMADQWGSLPSP